MNLRNPVLGELRQEKRKETYGVYPIPADKEAHDVRKQGFPEGLRNRATGLRLYVGGNVDHPRLGLLIQVPLATPMWSE